MASPSSPQHEPTMEEILASIRKIISEDSTEPQAAAPSAAAPAPMQAEADVLELTQEIEEVPEPAPVAPAPQPVQAAAPAPEPVRPAPQDDVVFQTVEEAPAPAVHAAATESLVSDKARGAIDDALSALDFGTPEPHNSTSPVAPIDGLSVEAVFDRAIRESFEPVLRNWLQQQAGVIVDRMKPAIREWMDDNLPEMLRAAVEAEVARAVKARASRR
jgi:cell pole-organizing protein PopZ